MLSTRQSRPEQTKAIASTEKRLVIHGASSGPSQVLMEKARKANSQNKKKFVMQKTMFFSNHQLNAATVLPSQETKQRQWWPTTTSSTK